MNNNAKFEVETEITISNNSSEQHMHKMLGVTVMKINTFIASANCWAQLQMGP